MLSEQELKNSFFEPTQVRKIWEEHKSQKYCWHHQLWTILNFQACGINIGINIFLKLRNNLKFNYLLRCL